jgi:putrescine aminotransferase
MHAQGGLPIPDIMHIDQPYWYGEGRGQDKQAFGLACAAQLEETIIRVGADKVAAFIGEPVQGAGGVIIPPASYWPEIQRICKKYDVLLIVDEVITGFGRTGKWFGSEYFDLDPDMMTLAKGLSSGYLPISAIMVSEQMAKKLEEDGGEFVHGYTYSAHPVCAAVALENIRLMEEERMIERAETETLSLLAEKWHGLSDHPLVGETRILGFMGALELTKNKETLEAFPESGLVGGICREYCFKNNLVMRAVGDSMVICPPLTINAEEIVEMVARARKSLDETLNDLTKKGLL